MPRLNETLRPPAPTASARAAKAGEAAEAAASPAPAAPAVPRGDGFRAGAPAPRAPRAPQARPAPGYTVQKGDTLGAIARRLGTSVPTLAQLNGLEDVNKLRAGQQLKLPGGEVVLVVEEGDSLAALATRYGLKEARLARANGLERGAALAAGQQLRLPGSTLYAVQQGDSLRRIARKHDTTVQALALANGLQHPSLIRVGQPLVIVGAGSAPEPGPTPGPTPRPQPGPTPAPDPALMKDHRAQRAAHRYQLDAKAKLVVGGMSADDVLQGAAGDCYLLSSLSALADAKPDVLSRAITANANGTFTVTFHELEYVPHPTRRHQTVERWKPVKVTVDGDLPGGRSARLYAEEGRSGRELWVPLVEKAWAAWKGGYEEIGNGGWPGEPLQSLAARGYQSIYLGATTLPTLLQEMVAAGGAGVACSRDARDVKGTGIIGAHAYAVLGVEQKGGRTYVQLRNPWGHTEAGRDGKDDGTFLLPWETFTKAFHLVEYV